MSRISVWSLVMLMGCADLDAPSPGEPAGATAPADAGEPPAAGDSDELDDSDEDEETDDGDAQVEEDGCPDTWVLTYGLEGRVDITDTPLDIGNAEVFVGGLDTDELVLRVPDDGGAPADGAAVLTAFNLLQDFTVSVNLFGEIALFTNLLSTAADECGVATGQLEGSTVAWDECSYGEEHGTTKWSPDEGAEGAGCVTDYRVEGIVDCVDDSMLASCEDGWLEEGENLLDYVYNQPMLDLEFDSTSLERFTMEGAAYGAELPTYTNNRTWLMLDGTLKSMSLEPTPDCLCGM